MKRVGSLYHYLISETVKPVCVFYGIMLIVAVLLMLLPVLFPPVSGEMQGQVTGLGFASTIFLLVTGLNSFKSGFIFASANGFTRRQYHCAVALMLVTVATVMSLADAGIEALINAGWPGFLAQWPETYPLNSQFELGIWQWAMNLLVVAMGLCITLAFYRLNKIGKLVLGLSPVYVSALLSFVDASTGNRISQWIGSAFETLQGMGSPGNALIGALSMAVAALALLALARLLMKGAPVKEQER